jgi:hypothetical protein
MSHSTSPASESPHSGAVRQSQLRQRPIQPEGAAVPARSFERCTAVVFARLVWAVGAAAREVGLVVPGFKDVPGGTVRHLRRRAGCQPLVVLTVTDRSLTDVRADVIEGVLAANRDAPAELRAAFAAVMQRGQPVQSAA